MTTPAQPKIKLYWLNESRAQRILWLLEELHLPYEVEIFHRTKDMRLAPPELEKIHPLGKAPILSITPSGAEEGAKPLLLAESGFMTQYLCEHFAEGTTLVPSKWQPGKEGEVAGETEAWLRYQHLLHYAEGSLMPTILVALIFNRIRGDAVPFFIRPITAAVASNIHRLITFPNANKHLAFLDSLLATSGGDFLCGPDLTAADILMSFPVLVMEDRFNPAGKWENGSVRAAYPRVFEYVARLEASPGFVKTVKKMEELDGGRKQVTTTTKQS